MLYPTPLPLPLPSFLRPRSKPVLARFAFAAAVWLAAGPNAGAQPAAPLSADPALLGCWRAERVEQTFADGSVWIDVGGCTLEFTAARIVSACVLRKGNQPVVYDYTLVAPGRYQARIVQHPAQPTAVGAERHYDYQIDGDRLFIRTEPQTAKPAPVGRAVQVLSVSVRVGSPADKPVDDGREQADCQGRLTHAPGAITDLG